MSQEPTDQEKHFIDRQIEDAVLIGDLRTELTLLKQRIENRIRELFDEMDENDSEEYDYNLAIIRELQKLIQPS